MSTAALLRRRRSGAAVHSRGVPEQARRLRCAARAAASTAVNGQEAETGGSRQRNPIRRLWSLEGPRRLGDGVPTLVLMVGCAVRSGGCTFSRAGSERVIIIDVQNCAVPPRARAHNGLLKAPAKTRSEAHCPDVLTVYYFKTSPGGTPAPTGSIPYPRSVASVGGSLRRQPNFCGAHSLRLYGDSGWWWLESRWQSPPWLCRLLSNRIRQQKQLVQFPVRVFALAELADVS